METERVRLHEIVVGEYRVLLRMEGDLFLPISYPKIRSFYERICQNTFTWGKEVLGKKLCREYAALSDPLEKARFPATRCNIATEFLYEDENKVLLLCRASWSGKKEGVYSYTGAWLLPEELLLRPKDVKKHEKMAAILASFGEKDRKKDC